MKDRRLLTAALLLPLTVLLLFAALAGGAASAGAAGAQPQVQDIAFETCVGASTEAALSAQDADGDVVLFQLTERPRLGTAEIEDDRIIYTPGARTGKDEFSYTAVDAEGNAAAPAKITVRIGKNRAGLTYSDMEGDPAHYAALCLAARGVMQGERIGDCAFFRPSQTVTRSEFIAMAASAAKLRIKPTDRTDFADDSGLSAWARPYISAAAADGLVCGYETAGVLNEIRGQNPITLAEASVVMANLLGDAAGVSEVMAAEHDEAADWAQRAVSAMARAEILDESTASGSASAPLTRRDACVMLCRAIERLQ
ncbi:S-layer homology domain-containing protein [Agathobaculum sp.]|uniref:S-layer homology domain-containing protein n=1 Tax=Agathobaculum sp. TaxID=2048138 RepID=UPI003AB60D44